MKKVTLFFFVLTVTIAAGQTIQKQWIVFGQKGYHLYVTPYDAGRVQVYARYIDNGIRDATGFFRAPYARPFDVFIHPTRHSLDSTWSTDWKTPGFKSECWMVGSGVAARLDLLSPATWDTATCEHSSRDTAAIQQIITHELVHIYHSQVNPSPDFSDVTGLDWFVEGLATYASGQCDSSKMAQVRQALISGKLPDSLANFWTGKWRYGLSGSVVMFVDDKYGRTTLVNLLKCTKLADLFNVLHTNEHDFLHAWKSYLTDRR